MGKFAVSVETVFVVEADNESEAFDMVQSNVTGAQITNWGYPDRVMPYAEDEFVSVYDFATGEKVSG